MSKPQRADYRAAVAGFAAIDRPLVLRGQTISGASLATAIAINPAIISDEAARTPQLIVELARMVAAANADREEAEMRYRIWRDKEIHKATTNLEYAIEIGAVPEDSKKPLAKTGAEDWTRTLPEYEEHNGKVRAATEVYNVVHGAFEAAKARTKAAETFSMQQGTSNPRGGFDDGLTVRHGGHGDGPPSYSAIENEIAAQALPTPLPSQGSVPVGPPPPAPRTAPPPPPPSTRRS